MPHLNLKISNNLAEFPFEQFAQEAHQLLSEYTKIESCKSKLDIVEDFYIGSNPENKGFVFLEVLVMPRPDELVKTIGQKLYDLLKLHAEPLIQKQGIKADVNLEVRLLNYYWQ